jgi:hypothetical protein
MTSQHTQHTDHPDIHGMAILVRKRDSSVYLSHLPMFSHDRHRYQVILEASLTKRSTPEGDLRKDQATHKALLYTLQPEEFSLPDLFQPDPKLPHRRSFNATIYRGHFERGGMPILDDVMCNVERVIYVSKFNPAAQELPELEYLLFGDREEQFLAHLITKPPDFDQLLAAKIDDSTLTDEELRRGVPVVFPGRSNTIEARLGTCQRLVGHRRADEASTVELQIETCEEVYFETGDLESG